MLKLSNLLDALLIITCLTASDSRCDLLLLGACVIAAAVAGGLESCLKQPLRRESVLCDLRAINERKRRV